VEIRPIRRYPAPHLPTREIVDQHPEILRLLPKRWQHNPAVLTAMVGVGLLLQCGGAVLAKQKPVFMGLPAPPALTSESEARRVIVAEAKLGVSYEYVSDKDWQIISARRGGVVPLATMVEAIKAQGKASLKGRVLVVPAVRAYSQQEAEQQIRAQVKDFI
jgi:hypothetical protein